ncbi:hypothetical protein ACHAC9_24305 [Massilia sp. CMS3.1]|uniref:hypothetical protein n=1 Tax=Massilia sp. CMS3.1 TaxID=3373083 RepID=UPI003EE595A4
MAQLSSDDHIAYSWLRANWFYPLAIAVVLGDVSALQLQDWRHPRLFESAVLFDLAVVLPLLYLWCYRARGTAVILPMVSLASLGIWATSHLIPTEHQHVLGSVGWLRTTAIAVLAMIEIKILFGFYKAIFVSDKTPEEIADKLSEDIKLPRWVTRLVVLEARVLRSLSHFVKSLLRRR